MEVYLDDDAYSPKWLSDEMENRDEECHIQARELIRGYR